MTKVQKISEAEMEVMQVIWRYDDGVTSAEILQQLNKEKSWKPTTVFTFLSRLVEKGVLKAEKRGKSNQYIPLMSENEYRCFEAKSFLNTTYKGSIKSFIAALYEGESISKEEIEELKNWLSKR